MNHIKSIILIFSLFLTACGNPLNTKGFNADLEKGVKGIPYFLPTARIKVSLVKNTEDTGPIYDLRINQTEDLIPDTGHPLVLYYEANRFAGLFSDEHLCVARSQTGLLESVQFVAADRTADVIIKVAETARAIALAAAGIPPVGGSALLSASKRPFFGAIAMDKGHEEFLAAFDPGNTVERDSVENAISDIIREEYTKWRKSSTDNGIDSGMVPIGGENNRIITSSNDNSNKEQSLPAKLVEFGGQAIEAQQEASLKQCKSGSLCFRTLKSSVLEFRFGSEKNMTPAWFKSVMIPDKKNVGVLDIGHAFLVHKVTKIGLDKGILLSVNINTPSSALATAELPLDVINALLDVPVGFFTNIAAGFQSEADATNAQTNRIVAQAGLDKAIRDALAGGIPTSVNTGSTPSASDIGAELSPPTTFKSGLTCVKVMGE